LRPSWESGEASSRYDSRYENQIYSKMHPV